jgi:Putative prokaryotic signal transducing protein
MSEMVVVGSYVNLIDAEVCASALEAAGIECAIHKDDCGGLRPHLWLSGVELLVHAEDAQRAAEVLATAAVRSPDEAENPEQTGETSGRPPED